MRDILFKEKCLDNDEWVEGYLVKHPSAIQFGIANYSPWYIHRPPVDPDDNGGVYNIAPETVCQYIGLSDKNKKKIFEGDVVRTKSGVGYINYGDGCFAVQDIKSKNNPAIDIVLNEGKIEIIGNIFDNPELLEVAE